jgi:hypothetical protein
MGISIYVREWLLGPRWLIPEVAQPQRLGGYTSRVMLGWFGVRYCSDSGNPWATRVGREGQDEIQEDLDGT